MNTPFHLSRFKQAITSLFLTCPPLLHSTYLFEYTTSLDPHIGQVIDVRKMFVGAISKVKGVPLVTRNVKHYDIISGLTTLKLEEVVKKTKL